MTHNAVVQTLISQRVGMGIMLYVIPLVGDRQL